MNGKLLYLEKNEFALSKLFITEMFSEEHHSTLAIFENSFEVSYVSYVSRPCEMKN